MNGLVWELQEIAWLDATNRAGALAFRTRPAAWAQFITAYPKQRQTHIAAFEATLDAVADLWGLAGRDEFDREARKRLGTTINL